MLDKFFCKELSTKTACTGNYKEYLLTIDKKETFFKNTRKMIDDNLGEKFVFIRYDIEKFGLINTFFGVNYGDELLFFFCQCLKKYFNLSTVHTFGHIRGDVFCGCYMIKNTEENILRKINDGIKNTIESYFEDYNLEVAVGIYFIEDNMLPMEIINSRAIMASKKCKNNCEVSYMVFQKEMEQNAINYQKITNIMRKSLKMGEFKVVYQPKYELNTNNIVGAEALVRWQRDNGEIIFPGDFIPVFEQNGFIKQMDTYVWDKVCKDINHWKSINKRCVPISVNVSRKELYNWDVCSVLVEMLQKYEIHNDLFHLEITESAYVDNSRLMVKTVDRLREYGFHIEMDDFGTGYSSLNMLNELQVDTLKLDMKFVQCLNNDNKGILKCIVNLAKELSVNTIVEGVEDIVQVEILKGIGCNMAQGYYFSKPIEKEEFEKLLEIEAMEA